MQALSGHTRLHTDQIRSNGWPHPPHHSWPCRQQAERICSPSRFLSGSRVRHASGSGMASSHRNRRTAKGLVCQATAEKLTVAITGATGLVGSRLVSKLTSQGCTARVLSRNPDKARSKLQFPRVEAFSLEQAQQALRGADAVVNLAGEPISTRWTAGLKREIKRSRVGVTQKLVEAINALPKEERPRVLCSASAVGYYGSSNSQTFSESGQNGSDYLAEVCREWEAAAQAAQVERVVIVRTGIVLAKQGGAMSKMLPVFQVFAGGPLGSGQQWMSWIHRDDLVNFYVQAIRDPKFKGAYNATAPNPVRMSELCSSMGSVLGRPSWLPVPEFALQTLLGEGASVVLEGQRVLPSRAQEAGFDFQFSEVEPALQNILS